MADTLRPVLERRLKAEVTGDVRFDRFTRGRYATDASHYQIMPLGVVAPRTMDDAARAIAIAREEGVSVLARGGGTSQCGQTVNASLVIDCSKYLNRILELDVEGQALRGRARHRAGRSQPRAETARPVVSGRYLDRLARHHRRHDRQQFLRRALAALRQYARERDFGERDPRRWPGAGVRAGVAEPGGISAVIADARSRLRSAGARRARSRRDRRAFSEGAAPRRRLQSRRAPARPQRSQPRAYPDRVGGHARLHHAGRTEAGAACSDAARSARAISAASTMRWMPPSISCG